MKIRIAPLSLGTLPRTLFVCLVDENGPIPESLPAKARGFIAGMGRGKKKALITDPLLVGIEDDGKQQYWFFLPVSNPKHFPMEERLKIIAS
ncbi:MAG TPA: hypothetical protein PLB62_00215, partial [Candidatus Sumerlaeota bacterium]|nr:hypothetical protein [Candidatus Sumerlaeota bacterium]